MTETQIRASEQAKAERVISELKATVARAQRNENDAYETVTKAKKALEDYVKLMESEYRFFAGLQMGDQPIEVQREYREKIHLWGKYLNNTR